jgi:hypothetical protein
MEVIGLLYTSVDLPWEGVAIPTGWSIDPVWTFFLEGDNFITPSEHEPQIAQAVAELLHQLRCPGS